MSKQRRVQFDGRSYTVSPWTLRETLSNRPIVDELPDIYRRYSEPDSDEDDASSAEHAMLHQHEHYDPSDREEDAIKRAVSLPYRKQEGLAV